MSSKSLNKSLLIGNLGADPKVRQTAGGVAVANFDVATTESWRDRNTGERQKRTDWHRVVFFARQAEVAGEYLQKGSKVYIEGRNQTRKWEDDQGIKRSITEVVGSELKMLDSRQRTDSGHGQQPHEAPDDDDDAPPPTQVQRPAPPAAGQTD